MPIVEQDVKQPGVYHFRESNAEKQARLEREELRSALAELQSREVARDPAYRPNVDLTKRKIEPKAPGG